MLCFYCNRVMNITNRITTGDNGLKEVEIMTHCVPCDSLYDKKNQLVDRLENMTSELKCVLREYRELFNERNNVKEELCDINEIITRITIDGGLV